MSSLIQNFPAKKTVGIEVSRETEKLCKPIEIIDSFGVKKSASDQYNKEKMYFWS